MSGRCRANALSPKITLRSRDQAPLIRAMRAWSRGKTSPTNRLKYSWKSYGTSSGRDPSPERQVPPDVLREALHIRVYVQREDVAHHHPARNGSRLPRPRRLDVRSTPSLYGANELRVRVRDVVGD